MRCLPKERRKATKTAHICIIYICSGRFIRLFCRFKSMHKTRKKHTSTFNKLSKVKECTLQFKGYYLRIYNLYEDCFDYDIITPNFHLLDGGEFCGQNITFEMFFDFLSIDEEFQNYDGLVGEIDEECLIEKICNCVYSN